MPQNSAYFKAQPQQVVFITSNTEAIWPNSNPASLEAFIDDCLALGLAVWITQRTVFVFTGEIDE